jgi:hypothetical protein
MYNRTLLVSLLLTLAGCGKDEIEFNAVPQIEVIAISPQSAVEFSDNVRITIRYKDGDGDLGENEGDVKNCFVKDNRIGITYEFRINQLAPDHSSVPITGNLNIDLGVQGITDSTSHQNVTYDIHITDRAGNLSNTVTAGPIVISK